MSELHESTPSEVSAMLVPDFGYGSVLETGRYALDRWAHGMFECSRELSGFAMARLEQDLETWKAFGNCRSLDEMMQCQCGFLQKAAADYMTEAGRLVQVMIDAASAALHTGPAQPAPAPPTWDVAPAKAPQALPQPAPARARSAAAARAADKRNR
jgi:hypothetical protein